MAQPTNGLNLNADTPTPPSGSSNVVFQSDGAAPMASISAFDPLMIGDSGAGGYSGNVPAPGIGDAAAGMFLRADGTWAVPSGSTSLSGSNINGYWVQDPASGVIWQWGFKTFASTSAGTAVTFPTPFTTLSSIVIQVTPITNGSYSSPTGFANVVGGLTTINGFTGTCGVVAPQTVAWFAVGEGTAGGGGGLPTESVTATSLWSYQVPSHQIIYSTPIVFTNNGVVNVAFECMDWYLYTLVASTGVLNWSKAFGDQCYGRPQAADVLGTGLPYIYGSSYDGEIHCLDHNGGNVWQFQNSYAREGTGTATSGTTNTLTDTTKSWAVGEFQSPRAAGVGYGAFLNITAGTGIGQTLEIASVSAHTLTTVTNWVTIPNATSVYTVTPRYSSDIYYEHAGTLNEESGTWYLYVTGFDGEIAKINATTGALVWKYECGENIEPFPLVMQVTGSGLQCVAVCVSGFCYCLNASTGALIWSVSPEVNYNTNQLDAFISASDINNDGIIEILIACRSSRVFVIQGTTGNVLSISGSNDGDVYAGVDNEPAILSMVSGSQNYVYGNHAGFIRCCNPAGATVWQTSVGGATINSSIRYGDLFNTGIPVLVCCDMAGTVSILNPLNGAVIGSIYVKGGIEGTPYVGNVTGTGGNQLLVTTLDGWVYCFQVTAGTGVPAPTGGTGGSSQTTISGSTSGTAVFSEPFQESFYKKVIIYLNAFSGTATYVFPTSFSFSPDYTIGANAGGATVTALSTTAITISGVGETGVITLEGY